MKDSILHGHTALIVGGSGGIGKSIASELAKKGASLIIHGKREAFFFQGNGDPHHYFSCSFQSPSQFLHQLSEFLLERQKPSIIACCYGPFLEKPLEETSTEDWEKLVLANLALPGALASYFMPYMREQKFGRFLFFGGTRTDTIRPFRKTAAYAAAKTGLATLVKSIAAQGAKDNIAALLVCPGPVDTEYLNPATRIVHAGLTPDGRLIPPDEIARISISLLDADPCIANGAIISLDAGFDP